MIRIVGPRDRHYDRHKDLVINTTSRSNEAWSRGLSPFHLGPVSLYPSSTPKNAHNVENAWQFAKVYPLHVDKDENPTEEYFEWARDGWSHRRAIRYPMGKGALPLYSWWEGEKLSYVEARKRIYVPRYTKAVVQTRTFEKLKEIHEKNDEIWFWDFDGYDHHKLGMTLKEVLNDPTRKMGHAFVLAMILEAMSKR